MILRDSFRDALDAAIDEMRKGRPLEFVLQHHARHEKALRPLLELVQEAHGAVDVAPPPSPRLDTNFDRVRTALHDARVAEPVQLHVKPGMERAPWWARKWAFASLSAPAAIVLFAFAGATGAAASAAVVAPELSAQVVDAVTPEWTETLVQHAGIGNGADRDERHARVDDDGDDTSGDPAGDEAVLPGSNSGEANDGAPPALETVQPWVTVSGSITKVTGNMFTLVSGEDEWRVQVDGKTLLSGALVEGANASVTGFQPGDDSAIHATEVTTDAAEDPSVAPGRDATPPPGQGNKPEDAGPPGGDESTQQSGGDAPPGNVASPSGGGDGQPDAGGEDGGRKKP